LDKSHKIYGKTNKHLAKNQKDIQSLTLKNKKTPKIGSTKQKGVKPVKNRKAGKQLAADITQKGYSKPSHELKCFHDLKNFGASLPV